MTGPCTVGTRPRTVTTALTDLSGIDFVALAARLGVEGRRVEQADNLRGALEWALALGRPSLVEVMVDPQDAGYAMPRVP